MNMYRTEGQKVFKLAGDCYIFDGMLLGRTLPQYIADNKDEGHSSRENMD